MRFSEETRTAAQEAFSPLIGLPLSDMWRYGSQKFEFGEQKPHLNRKGEETTWADWGLVVAGAWHLSGPNGFALSSEHFAPERHDEHAKDFYESLDDEPPIVQTVEVLENGGLRIEMSRGYRLGIDPRSTEEEYFEEWRLMPPNEAQGHLVLDHGGLEWSG